MSGHSKWAKLKHSKGAIDAKKGSLFTKVARMITVAAREGGGDPQMNFKLRLAIDKARQINMPNINVERAIDRGIGKTKETAIESVTYEAYLPSNAALVIEVLTDNRNRTLANLRHILSKYGGNLAKQNSVLWMFEKKGVIRISDLKGKDLDELQLKIIDLGVEDVKKENDELVVLIKTEDLERVKNALEQEMNLKVDYAEIEWFAKNLIKISPEDQKKVDAIFAELDENPDINDYYSNIG
ncbi:MAG: putative transcriptional regulatory protein YebC [Parcubacteria group bacterium ADurb.Bin159]|jgi:YebC/PmpR family DNA-binding regulatory protein|nr:MAG: putative transcriptional regulatory protein YebC [Parcubacteria group bacterium ADurb.Bin159]